MQVGDICRVALLCSWNVTSDAVVNVWHFRAVDNVSDVPSLLADIAANVVPAHKNCTSNGLRYVELEGHLLIGSALDVGTVVLSGVGADSFSAQPPPQCAAVITWGTAQRGRSHRGRSFIGPLSVAALGAGVLSAPILTSLNTLGALMHTRYNTGGGFAHVRFGVWSRKLGGQSPPHDPAGFTDVTQHLVRPTACTLRSRVTFS